MSEFLTQESLKVKKILVLRGKDDVLVPWSTSSEFISLLQHQSKDIKVKLYNGVGHRVVPEMVDDFYDWILQCILFN